ncbi:MAG: dihydrodipicolinate reductase C-terminal domain-containing protein, partial [Chloroflexota bacterium]
SGTARELAHRLGQVREAQLDVALDDVQGDVQTRGARLNGAQVHAIRLPGYVISAEVIFGMEDQKLILRHESGSSSQPYVDGAMLAIRKVGTFSGLRRGLDSVMEF